MAIDRAWFSYVNHLKTATVTTDSEETALPVTNIVDRLTYRVWRTDGATAAYMRAEWTTAVEMQAFVFAFPPIRDPGSALPDPIDPTDTISIKVSDVSAGASELLNISEACGVNRVRGYYAKVADSAVTGKYLEIAINASSRSSIGYFEGSYAHAGPLFQPAINYAQGSQVDFQEQSLASISPFSGSTYTQSRARLLGFSGLWDLISQSEQNTWHEMQEKAGVTQPIAFGLTASGDLSRKAFIARFESPMQISFGGNRRARARVNLLENR